MLTQSFTLTADELDRIVSAHAARIRAEDRGDEPAVLLPHQVRRLTKISQLQWTDIAVVACGPRYLRQWAKIEQEWYAAGDVDTVVSMHYEAATSVIALATDLLSPYLL